MPPKEGPKISEVPYKNAAKNNYITNIKSISCLRLRYHVKEKQRRIQKNIENIQQNPKLVKRW